MMTTHDDRANLHPDDNPFVRHENAIVGYVIRFAEGAPEPWACACAPCFYGVRVESVLILRDLIEEVRPVRWRAVTSVSEVRECAYCGDFLDRPIASPVGRRHTG